MVEKPMPPDVAPPVIVAGRILDAPEGREPDPKPNGWE
jgi:hypothetical protein